ncbi:HA1F protein, partial [Sula dactylatra]|nr:HA1F protein [Sula dactylatra]
SLRYFTIAVSEPSPGVPQFMSVGYVDQNPFVHYDSKRRKMEPRARWMAAKVDQQYWARETQKSQTGQESYSLNLDIL